MILERRFVFLTFKKIKIRSIVLRFRFEKQSKRKMKLKLGTISILLLFIFSCKKETVIPPCESGTSNSYFPMTVGSYWIYQWYRVDLLEGEETLLEGIIDTIEVLKDTLIRYNYYAKIRDNNAFEPGSSRTYYRRDSFGYLVDPRNSIYFSSTNFVDTLRIEINPIFKTIYKMEFLGSSIETAVKTFDCRNFQGEITNLFSPLSDKQYYNNYYSKKVGKIQSNIFYFSMADKTHFHRRLIEYHLE